MAEFLHLLLLALVLLDLGFVQATGVLTFQALLPLWLFAAAAPWLRQLQRHLAYRVAWNGGVLIVFALLVHHATTSGLLHMLEDGLVLAVLCQVHLLNNVGERQRPDLVFFNSFLIAFVTGFFAPDLPWSLLFVGHALVLVPSLQCNVMARRGVAGDAALRRAVLRDSLPHTAAIAAATAVLFVLLPRDFHREGWLGDAIAAGGLQREAGLGEQIRLDDDRAVHLGTEVVLRVRPSSGLAEDVPEHWRGTVFTVFDGIAWSPVDTAAGPQRATDPAWAIGADGTWRRTRQPNGPKLKISLFDRRTPRLPLPLDAGELTFARGSGALVDPQPAGTFTLVRAGDAPSGPLTCSVTLAGGTIAPVVVGRRAREPLLQVPHDRLPAAALSLADQLRTARGAANASPEEVAAATCRWLQEHRRYQLPGAPGFARDLTDFLLGTGAGHCEYFATAMALLLRLQDVPCRVAGGYLVHERDGADGTAIARARDAHAWVEVLGPDGRWSTWDPTPAAELGAALAAETTWWGAIETSLEQSWAAVVGFDGRDRAGLVAALMAIPARVVAAVGWPGRIVILVALACLWRTARRRRRLQALPTIRRLLRAARRVGLEPRPGETPRELLARATETGPPADRLRGLELAVQEHEASRYAAATESAMSHAGGLPLVLFAVFCTAPLTPAVAQEPPAVVSLTPQHLAVGIDSAKVGQFVAVFDQDMDQALRPAATPLPGQPKTTRTGWRDARTLVVDVELQAERVYSLDLAAAAGGPLRSAAGVPLPPTPWCVATAGPPLAKEVAETAANRLFEALRDRYSYRDRIGIDWGEIDRRHREELLSAPHASALALRIFDLLRVAQDVHVTVRFQDAVLQPYPRQKAPNFDSRGLQKLLPKLQRVGRIGLTARTDDGIGYLLVASFAREQRDDLEKVLDALRSLRDTRALVLDVRTNGGGDELLARRLAAFFVVGEKVYAAHRLRDPSRPDGFGEREDRFVRGNVEPDVYPNQVAVLMGPANVSSAEAFLLMMKQAPKAVLFGAPSAGSSGNPQQHTLAPGLSVGLPSWQALRPDGTCFEGEGIAPYIAVAATPEQLRDGDPVLEEALQRLRGNR